MRILSSGFLLITLLFPFQIFAQDSELSASLRTGVEYDDNVRRETTRQDAGLLIRYFGALRTNLRPFSGARIVFDAKHGGKFFLKDTYADSDTLITQFRFSFHHQLRLKSESKPGVFYDLSVDMKDRTERVPTRDYNRAGVGGGINIEFEDIRFRIGSTYRYFAFKPDPNVSSSNVEGNTSLFWNVNNAFSLSSSYTFARRLFETERFEKIDAEIDVVEGEFRRDTFHSMHLQGYYTGSVIATLGYNLALNYSNSFGQELVRHSLSTSLTAPLVFGFIGTLKVELQRTRYDDPVRIDAAFLIDEDNRNAIVISLAREFGEHWEAELRYSLFLQEFGVGSDYRRQTLFLAFAYLYD